MKYSIPFNRLFTDKSTRYINFGGVFNDLPDCIITGEVPSFSLQTSDVLMMTGASDNHALMSFNCLYSMVLADPYASYVYLNLGMNNRTENMLFSHFRTIIMIQGKMKSSGIVGYRVFNWVRFPEWMSIKKRGARDSGYSWKVIPVVDVFYEWKAILYWLDGGCVIRDGINREVTMARHHGLFSPHSGGDVNQWTHNDTQHFMVKNGLLHHYVDGKQPMAMGGVFVMDYSNATIRNRVVPLLLRCAYTQKCIVPKNSSYYNHRQDQSVLTLLIAEYHIPYCATVKYKYTPALHTDGLTPDGIKRTALNLLTKIQNTYNIRVQNEYYNITGWKQTREEFHEVSREIDDSWY